jgi:septal ring-binding cell division protein DamX
MTKKKPLKQIFLFAGLMLVLVLIFGGRHLGIKGISDLLNPLRSTDKTRPVVLAAGIQPMVIWKKIQKSSLTQPSIIANNLNAGTESVLKPDSEPFNGPTIDTTTEDTATESTFESSKEFASPPPVKTEKEPINETVTESVIEKVSGETAEKTTSAVALEDVLDKPVPLYKEPVTVAAVELNRSTEPQPQTIQNTVLTQNPSPLLPYTLQLSSCRTLKSAQNSMNDHKKNEIDVYLAKVQLGGQKGTWWRVFTGQYQTLEDALDKKRKLGLADAIVKKTPYANLIGEYASLDELHIEQERLTTLGLSFYVNEMPNHTYRLLVGAYTRKAQAEQQARELESMGLMSQTITR